jgi:hypothetical protein
MVGLFVWLMVWRVLNRFDRGREPLVLAALAIATSAFSFAFTIVWLAIYQRRPALPQVWLAFNLGPGLAPAWQVLVLGIAVALLAAVLGTAHARRRPQAATATGPASIPAE